jgi:hypothetical protein
LDLFAKSSLSQYGFYSRKRIKLPAFSNRYSKAITSSPSKHSQSRYRLKLENDQSMFPVFDFNPIGNKPNSPNSQIFYPFQSQKKPVAYFASLKEESSPKCLFE